MLGKKLEAKGPVTVKLHNKTQKYGMSRKDRKFNNKYDTMEDSINSRETSSFDYNVISYKGLYIWYKGLFSERQLITITFCTYHDPTKVSN